MHFIRAPLVAKVTTHERGGSKVPGYDRTTRSGIIGSVSVASKIPCASQAAARPRCERKGMVEMDHGLARGLLPELEPEPPAQRGVFVAVAIGLIGVLILGLLGIGALVVLDHASGGDRAAGGASAWVRSAGAGLVQGDGGALNLVLATVAVSLLVAALVGYIVAYFATRGLRRRITLLEAQLRNTLAEPSADATDDDRRLDDLRDELEMRSERRMDALEAKMMATLRGWMDDVSRTRR